jgi:hypothetical protein
LSLLEAKFSTIPDFLFSLSSIFPSFLSEQQTTETLSQTQFSRLTDGVCFVVCSLWEITKTRLTADSRTMSVCVVVWVVRHERVFTRNVLYTRSFSSLLSLLSLSLSLRYIASKQELIDGQMQLARTLSFFVLAAALSFRFSIQWRNGAWNEYSCCCCSPQLHAIVLLSLTRVAVGLEILKSDAICWCYDISLLLPLHALHTHVRGLCRFLCWQKLVLFDTSDLFMTCGLKSSGF